jgi:hypothetical protein
MTPAQKREKAKEVQMRKREAAKRKAEKKKAAKAKAAKRQRIKDGKPLLDKEGKPRRHEVFNFGKYKGWDVAEILRKDPGYYSWMLGGDFTNNTKQALTRIRLREMQKGQ